MQFVFCFFFSLWKLMSEYVKVQNCLRCLLQHWFFFWVSSSNNSSLNEWNSFHLKAHAPNFFIHWAFIPCTSYLNAILTNLLKPSILNNTTLILLQDSPRHSKWAEYHVLYIFWIMTQSCTVLYFKCCECYFLS